jgi:Reverse transcriptase (RNA-dependent DNA polymerase)
VCAIYNASVHMREGVVPSRWKEANVVPVPKVQPRAVESDLRPISLTATLAKLLESFVGSWILERVGSSLDDRQYGALRQHSTTHALVDMLHHWHAAVDKGQSVRTVFVDFAKAFDHVDYNVLVAKLVALGLSDFIVRWMCAFLSDRRQRVKISAMYCLTGGGDAAGMTPRSSDVRHPNRHAAARLFDAQVR